jgi:hypothetical protein
VSSTNDGTAVVHAYSSSGGLCLGSRAYRESTAAEAYSPGFGDGNVATNGIMSNGYLTIWYGWGGLTSTIGRMVSGAYTQLATVSDTPDQAYHLFDFVWDNNSLRSYRDGSLKLSGTDSTYGSQSHVHLSSWGTSTWDTDWIFIRKYASPEPGVSNIESEQATNANLTIWDDTDPEGGSQTKYINEQIYFYANYTNRTSGESISGAGVSCNISFDVTPKGPHTMTYNSSSSLYEYNRSFSSSGVINWNVSCKNSQGYENMSATDTVTVSTSNYPPNIIPNKPDNGSSTPNNWAILNATVTDADDDNTTVYFYANNNSNGLNASESLVYIGENVANGTTLTYNLTALPIKPSEANLSLLMHFDNRSGYGENGTHTYDFSGNENNGTVNGNPGYNISGGKFAGAYEFDGDGDYVTASHTPIVNDFTFSMWIKPVELGQRDEWAAASTGSGIAGWYWHNNWDTNDYNYLGLELSSGSWSQCQGIAIADIALNEWHHVAFTKSSSVGVKIYHDGSLVGNCSGYTNDVIDEGNTLYIGRGYPDGNNRYFNGAIDEVAIYNKTLSADEILNHYRLGEGKYYWKVNATDGLISNESSIWNFTIGFAGDTYIPPDPKNIQSTSGNFWVHHVWEAGTGNVTNSYNVSVNGVWHNGTAASYSDTYTAHAWQNITVYAYNTSGTGTLSSGNVSQDAQIPNNAVTITNTSGWSGDAGENVYVDYDATDADSDTPTFSCNRTDLFTDFSTTTGKGNWTAVAGTYYVDFGVSDGYGSTDNYTMTITVGTPSPEYIPPDPVNLANSTGNFWVNYTWSAGGGNVTDLFNVSMNGTWTNDSALTYMNVSVGSGGWANITVWAWNASGTGTISAGCVSDEVRAPGANANLSIWDDTDPEEGSQTKYANNKVCFYANYTNKTSGGSINGSGVYCNISFNVTLNGPFDMPFNSSSLLYEYNRTFSSAGTYEWNVTCNGSVQGYDVLNATDTVTISPTNNPPAITPNKPDNCSTIPNNWTILNATVTDADNDPMTVYFYANNNSNGLNASEGLVYIGENVANETTLTYNLTALPIKPSEANLSLLMHFDNRSEYGENGTHVFDFSRNGNNGTMQDNAFINSSGKFGKAVQLDGSGDNVSVMDAAEPNAYTLSAWVKPNDVTSVNIIVRTPTGGPTSGWSHQLRITSGSKFEHYLYDYVSGKSVTGKTTAVAGNWYHVAGVAENSGNMRLYVNGKEEGNSLTIGNLWTGGDRWYIGSNSGTGGSAMGYFNGLIDEVAIYNRSLSEDEILNHYRLGVGKYYWKVNASDGVLSNESYVWEFNVADQTAPSIQLNYPDDKANMSSSTVNFNWTAADNIDDVLLCNLTIDGVVNQSDIASTSGQPRIYSVSGISTGVHNWSVTCRDDAPNVNTSETRTFGVNNSAPNVTLNSPPNGSSTPNSWAILNATVTDADDDPMTVYFYANSNSNGLNDSEGLVYIRENVANGTTLTYNLTALPIKPSEANLSLLVHFDNRSGYGENSTHVYDYSRNGNNGTVNGNPIYNISGGKFAGAFEFDGTEDYVDCGNDPGLPENTSFTVSAWVKLKHLNQGEWKVVTNKLGTGNYVTLTIFLSPANEFSFTTANGLWGSISDLKTPPVSATNQWYHVVSTWNGTTKCIYLDGDLSNSTNPDSGYEPGAGTGNFSIGARVSGLYCLDGVIDEVAIYNRSMSKDEVLTHYRLGEGKYYWKVNATDGVLSNESEVWNFTIGTDQTAPSIQLNYPDDKANQNSSTVDFNWTATDNLDNVLLCNLTIDGVVNQSNIDSTSGQPTIYSVSGLSTGVHNWSVTCRDDASNVNTSETRTFGVNDSAPNVTPNSPPSGLSTPNSWVILNATVTDADDDPMTVYFYANNNSNGLNDSEGLVYIGENVVDGTTLTYNLTALPIKPSEANLSLLLHFDNRSEFGEHTRKNVANAVYDFSGNGNNGTLGNATAGTAPTWNVTGGKFAGAFEFDGGDDFINCGNDPLFRYNQQLDS